MWVVVAGLPPPITWRLPRETAAAVDASEGTVATGFDPSHKRTEKTKRRTEVNAVGETPSVPPIRKILIK